jgi:(S)-ureidoglycine aminohydrolase
MKEGADLNPLGQTRTTVRRNHALITPDSHVLAPLPDWERTRGVTQISPAMGAGLVQYVAHVEAGSSSAGATAGVERFLFVMEGTLEVEGRELAVGGYAYFPADRAHRISARGAARVLVIEKAFESGKGARPEVVIGDEVGVSSAAFMGDPDAQLKLLLPDTPAFDMAVNIFTYRPGAMLPQVECHVMEHGLVMLQGMGVYRLDDQWYPVQAGDVIWMAPYCPQWFIAGGKQASRYIYYKDVNRAALGVRR